MAMTHGGAVRGIFARAGGERVRDAGRCDEFEEAASMPIVYHTSYFALTHRTQIAGGRMAAGARGRERRRDVGDPDRQGAGRHA